MPEDEYALTFGDGKAWQLAAATLAPAAGVAARREDTQARESRLSATTTDVLKFVRQHPEASGRKDVVDRFGKTSTPTWAGWLIQAGSKQGRGFYRPVQRQKCQKCQIPRSAP